LLICTSNIADIDDDDDDDDDAAAEQPANLEVLTLHDVRAVWQWLIQRLRSASSDLMLFRGVEEGPSSELGDGTGTCDRMSF
jgi:hypothetical protein